MIVGFFCFTLVVAWASRDLPDPNKLMERHVSESTKMYDRTGEHLLYEVYDEKKRTMVETATLPKYILDATVTIEDKHFYEHSGVRWISIARAAVANFLHLSSGQGGASTLTQQLVKNVILTNEHSLVRKIREAILALQIERKFTKDQILKMYLNEIPYGSTNYGIESAAQAYFHKQAKDLTLAEAATLAALPQAPTRYLNNQKLLSGRRDYVLEQMVLEGKILKAEATEAKKQNTDIKSDPHSMVAPHFVMYIKDLLINEYGEQMVDQGGLKVITTLDFDVQQTTNETITAQMGKIGAKYKATNAAAVTLDPNNGEILAMVGSKDFFDEDIGGQFNVVTQGVRQPGSSFKPIIYAAAFAKGFTPDTVLFDTGTDFPYDGKIYHPHNYDLVEHGPLTMRQTLQGSLNIPAVKTVFLVGVSQALDFVNRMGYSTFKDASQFGPSVVLGGGGVKMIDHARAFAVFANGGKLVEPTGLLKVEDRKGKDVTPKKETTEFLAVITPELAATVSNVLSDNAARAFIFGEKNYLTLSGRPVAAKTGTTNDYHDAWTMGYTPQIVTGVWVGNNDNKPMKGGADGSVVAAPIWQAIMKKAHEKLAVQEFSAPPVNISTKPILRGQSGGMITVEVDKISGKLATADTPKETIEKRMYLLTHDILYYVNPEDPNGPAPTSPWDNPQAVAWDVGVQNWLQKKQQGNAGVFYGEPPSEYDDVHKKEWWPTLQVLSPQTGQIIIGDVLIANISANAPRGISRVEYLLDGILVATNKEYPFALNYLMTGMKKGNHTLKISVFDDVSNATSQEISFQFAP